MSGTFPEKHLHIGAVATVTPEARQAATRYIASQAVDAQDCARLLDMLGLDAEEGRRG